MGFSMPNPRFVVLQGDVEATLTLDSNFGQVEVTIVANPALTYFNATDTAIPAVAGSMDGNHALSATLVTKTVQDQTTGNTKVRIRSAGTPTVQVLGL